MEPFAMSPRFHLKLYMLWHEVSKWIKTTNFLKLFNSQALVIGVIVQGCCFFLKTLIFGNGGGDLDLENALLIILYWNTGISFIYHFISCTIWWIPLIPELVSIFV